AGAEFAFKRRGVRREHLQLSGGCSPDGGCSVYTGHSTRSGLRDGVLLQLSHPRHHCRHLRHHHQSEAAKGARTLMSSPAENRTISSFRFSPAAIISLAIILFCTAIAIIGPWIAPHPPGRIVDFDVFGPMSASFPAGSDYMGRDML